MFKVGRWDLGGMHLFQSWAFLQWGHLEPVLLGLLLCEAVPLGIVEGGQGHRRLGSEVIVLIV